MERKILTDWNAAPKSLGCLAQEELEVSTERSAGREKGSGRDAELWRQQHKRSNRYVGKYGWWRQICGMADTAEDENLRGESG